MALEAAGLRGNILKMLRAALTGRVSRAQWRKRMRTCLRCPIYNHAMKTCRSGVLGCGCYVPFKAMVKRPYAKGCWGRTATHGAFGWE